MRNVIPRDVEACVQTLCRDIATPRSLTVEILVRYREWDQLAALACDPLHYNLPEQYRNDALVTDLLRKCVDLPTSVDRRKKAEDVFDLCEKSCYRTNERISPLLYGGGPVFSGVHHEEVAMLDFVELWKKAIMRIIGTKPRPVLGRFGPGATYGDKGAFTTVAHKMSSEPTFTELAEPFFFDWVFSAWATASRRPEFTADPTLVPGNRFTTVPKDCSKDRGIAVEPSINSFYQLGYGSLLKDLMRESGLNLIKAPDNHRLLARVASKEGHLATLDLSNASDTICTNLVRLLLPPDWFDALNRLRSPRTFIQGKWVKLEKFSSMGNGYTFELESLIFFTLAQVCCEVEGVDPVIGVNLSCFGDDIICPTAIFGLMCSALRFFGLEPNPKKSFSTGLFRESCGGDFFKGVSSRSYFLKAFPTQPQEWIAFANGIRHFFEDTGADLALTPGLRCWFQILDQIPRDIRRLRGPKVLGDLVIHDSIERWICRWRSGVRYIRCYRPARFLYWKWDRFHPAVTLACALYGVGDGIKGIMPRDSVLGYKQGWVPRS